MALTITSSGPCKALGPALASIQAVKDRNELDALRNVAKDPEQLSLYWSADDLPDFPAWKIACGRDFSGNPPRA